LARREKIINGQTIVAAIDYSLLILIGAIIIYFCQETGRKKPPSYLD
jgi:hypothetical protein